MTRTFLVDSYGIFLPFLLFETEKQEWTRNEPGMNQEYSPKIAGVIIPGLFLVHSVRETCKQEEI